MPDRTKEKPSSRLAIWGKSTVHFDRYGRLVIADKQLRAKIEKQVSAAGGLRIVTGGILETCPPSTGNPKKPVPNTMCACNFVLTVRQRSLPTKTTTGGH